jgi:hypothetical protein
MGCELLQYNHRGWLNEAANYDRSKQSWIPKNQGFRKSHWYKFQEAVKVYQKLFEKNCKNLLHTTKETIDQNTETG